MKITWIILLSVSLATLSAASSSGAIPTSCTSPGSIVRKTFDTKKLSAMKQFITKKIAPGLMNIQKFNPSGQLGRKLKPLRQAFSKNHIQKKLLAPVTYLIAVQQGKKKATPAKFEKVLGVFIGNVDTYMAKISSYQQLTKSVKNSKLRKVVKGTSEQTLRLVKKLHGDYQKTLAYSASSMYPAPGIDMQRMMPPPPYPAWPQQQGIHPIGALPGMIQGAAQQPAVLAQPQSTQAAVTPGSAAQQPAALAQSTSKNEIVNSKGSASNTHTEVQPNVTQDQKGQVTTQQSAQTGAPAPSAQCNCAGQSGAAVTAPGTSVGTPSSQDASGAQNVPGTAVVASGTTAPGTSGAVDSSNKSSDPQKAAEQKATQLAIESAQAAVEARKIATEAATSSSQEASAKQQEAEQLIAEATHESEAKQQKADELAIVAKNALAAIPASAANDDGVVKLYSGMATDPLHPGDSAADTEKDGIKVIYSNSNTPVLIRPNKLTPAQTEVLKAQAAELEHLVEDADQTTAQPEVADAQHPDGSVNAELDKMNSFSQSQTPSE